MFCHCLKISVHIPLSKFIVGELPCPSSRIVHMLTVSLYKAATKGEDQSTEDQEAGSSSTEHVCRAVRIPDRRPSQWLRKSPAWSWFAQLMLSNSVPHTATSLPGHRSRPPAGHCTTCHSRSRLIRTKLSNSGASFVSVAGRIRFCVEGVHETS